MGVSCTRSRSISATRCQVVLPSSPACGVEHGCRAADVEFVAAAVCAQVFGSIETAMVTHTVMLTGDAQATAEHVAANLGVTDVHADCLPLDKVNFTYAAPALTGMRPETM